MALAVLVRNIDQRFAAAGNSCHSAGNQCQRGKPRIEVSGRAQLMAHGGNKLPSCARFPCAR